MTKPGVYITTNVFKEIAQNPKVSKNVQDHIVQAWNELEGLAHVTVHDGRFPDPDVIETAVLNPAVRFIGCHLSHRIDQEWLNESNVVAVSTATMGFDHVGQAPSVIITHTPGVLQNAVGDYTMALILSTLRNVVDLHDLVWSGSWKAGQKWDLDGDLSRSLDGQVIGIIGMGEIGSEMARRVQPWGTKIIYYDIERKEGLESELGLEYVPDMETVFASADVVSLHMPLNARTKGSINRTLLEKMKDDALLVNTARGGVLNTKDLQDLLESGQKKIHVAFDVHESEPLNMETLERYRKIKDTHPEVRITLMPHNASADANTRGKMAIMLLEDLAWLVSSRSVHDLEKCRIIGKQKQLIFEQNRIEEFRIHEYWRDA